MSIKKTIGKKNQEGKGEERNFSRATMRERKRTDRSAAGSD